ncbi:MAG: M23 family metallopeptidase [Oscillospiraceae bacterium]
MKENKITRQAKSNFLSGKSFYIALSITLIVLGTIIFFGVKSSMDNLKENNEQQIEQNNNVVPPVVDDDWSTLKEAPVAKPQTDVKKNEEVSSKKVESTKPASNAPMINGFIYPVRGAIQNDYSGENLYKSKTLDEWVMHTGVDIASKVGTPVKASSNGKVISVWDDEQWGGCVKIQHANNIVSHYYNLKSGVNVSKNQEVKLGDVIGAVGTSAIIESAEEPHLHFAIQKDGNWVNPKNYLPKI